MASKSIYSSCICYYNDWNNWAISLYYAGDFSGRYNRLFEDGSYADKDNYFDNTGLVD